MKKVLTLLSILLFNSFINAQSLELDTTFNSTDTGFNNGAGISAAGEGVTTPYTVDCSVIQPDGKAIISGNYNAYNGIVYTRKPIRLNTNGTVDSSFNFNATSVSLIDIRKMALEPDGKIILFGKFQYTINGTYYSRYVVRLNPDGSIVTNFNPALDLSSNTIILNDCAVQPDGKIILVGKFTSSEAGRNCVLRMNADGTFDGTFNPGGVGALFGTGTNVNRVKLQPDGKIIIGGNFGAYNGTARKNIARLNADGTLDLSFNPGTGFDELGATSSDPAELNSLALQADGKLLVGGKFKGYNGVEKRSIIRINTDGSADTTFDIGLGASYTFQGGSGGTYDYPAMVRAIVVQPDGKIVLGGYFERFNGVSKLSIARLNPDGTLDTTFQSGSGTLHVNNISSSMSVNGVFTLNIRPDQRILISGQFKTYNNIYAKCLALTDAEGNIDLSFNSITGFDETVYRSAVQSDGKILVGGRFTKYNGINRRGLVRLNTDGSIDNSFVIGSGIQGSISGLSVKSIVIQPDNKIIVAGFFTSFNGVAKSSIVRLNPDGSIDNSFTLASALVSIYYPINKIVLQNDGKILILQNERLNRLNSDGSLDPTFSMHGCEDMFLLANGKILVKNDTFMYSYCLRQLNTDGTLDGSFPVLVFSNNLNSVDLQPDGKIILAGEFDNVNGYGVNRIARLNPDGTLDMSLYVSDDAYISEITTVKVMTNGKILITGRNLFYDTFLYLLSPNGTVESNFANSEINGVNGLGYIYDINVQASEGIYIGGDFVSFGTEGGRNRFARLVDTPLGLDDFASKQVKIYPNPTNGILNIDMPDDLMVDKVEVYNNLGQLVISQKSLSDNRILDVSNLRGGIYYLKMNADDKLITRKFIKE